MKKFIANAQVRNLTMSLFFLLGLMFFGSSSATAQSSINGSTTNWVTDGQAVAFLTAEVKQLKQQNLPGATGTEYANFEAKYHFYVGMIESINGGMGTEAAFLANLINITSQPSVNDVGFAAANQNTPVDTKAIKAAAVSLLTY